MLIRTTRSDDEVQIKKLLDRAFAPSVSESCLVATMRQRGKISLEMVIEQTGNIVAYICYTRAFDPNGRTIGYHLAPLAVLPGKQRRGLGQRLIRESIAALKTRKPVYVLGDPDYYSRSGFLQDRTQQCPFDPEGRHFLVFSTGRLPRRNIGYENEFYEVAANP